MNDVPTQRRFRWWRVLAAIVIVLLVVALGLPAVQAYRHISKPIVPIPELPVRVVRASVYMDGGSINLELRDAKDTYLKIFLGAAEPEDRSVEANRFIVAAYTEKGEESRHRSFGSPDARTACIWLTAAIAQQKASQDLSQMRDASMCESVLYRIAASE